MVTFLVSSQARCSISLGGSFSTRCIFSTRLSTSTCPNQLTGSREDRCWRVSRVCHAREHSTVQVTSGSNIRWEDKYESREKHKNSDKQIEVMPAANEVKNSGMRSVDEIETFTSPSNVGTCSLWHHVCHQSWKLVRPSQGMEETTRLSFLNEHSTITKCWRKHKSELLNARSLIPAVSLEPRTKQAELENL